DRFPSRRAAQLKIGYVFITDDVTPNPYDRLPSYWEAEVDAVCRETRPRAEGLSPKLASLLFSYATNRTEKPKTTPDTVLPLGADDPHRTSQQKPAGSYYEGSELLFKTVRKKVLAIPAMGSDTPASPRIIDRAIALRVDHVAFVSPMEVLAHVAMYPHRR